MCDQFRAETGINPRTAYAEATLQSLERAKDDLAEALSGLPDDPVRWTERTRVLKGEPFSFLGREYLHQIYRDDAKEVYIMKGRQTEITEFLVNALLFNAWRFPGTVHLYIADRQSHTSKFSNLRVHDWALKPSALLNRIAPWRTHTAEKLPFENTSIAYFHSAWSNFEEARSVPADFVYLDEIQSVAVDEIDVLRETLAHSRHGRLIGVGTGGWVDGPWDKLWKSGTQYAWNAEAKAWRARNPGAGRHSYQIPQTIVPWLDVADIERKYVDYTRARFAMEVLGESAYGAAKPITEAHVRAILDTTAAVIPASAIPRTGSAARTKYGRIICGIDWAAGGESSTVLTFARVVDEAIPILRVCDVIRIRDTTNVREIGERAATAIRAYDPDYSVMDAGGNAAAIQDVEHVFGTSVRKCLFMVRPQEPWKFDAMRSDNVVKVDRTFAFQNVVDLITRPHVYPSAPGVPVPRVQIPYADPLHMDWLVSDYTSVETERTRLASGEEYLRYTKPDDRTYDGLLSMLYTWVAWSLLRRDTERGAAFSEGGLA